MSSFCYEAVDAGGLKMEGTLDVMDQGEALRRIRQMGLFPVKVAEQRQPRLKRERDATRASGRRGISFTVPLLARRRPRPRVLAVFTRQLATLVEAGLPVLRGLRTLQEQEDSPALRTVIAELGHSIESGMSLSEAMGKFPRVFNPLYLNMVRAGELGGALEITLRRLAEFMEKWQKIKGKVKAAMFYPCAVMLVAISIVTVLMVFVVPRFKQVFDGLLNGASMPKFTLLVLSVSETVKAHFVLTLAGLITAGIVFMTALRTKQGRRLFDGLKLRMPVLGPVFRKVAIARFSRTFGTLLNSGVPVLQALAVVRETAGNSVVASVIQRIHDSVKEGESITAPLRASHVFPPMVGGMVDVGEQTGALPDMLLKVADTYDDEVDNAVSSMTSLLEPILIIFLAIVVGSIVIAMFLPLISIMDGGIVTIGEGEP